jgi:translation initiation factor 2 subunit 2
MSETYEELLDRVLEQVPRAVFEASRFQIPEADIAVAGNQTTIKNLKSIASSLNRRPEHLVKYMLRELAVAGIFKETQLVLQGRFPKGTVEERIKRYVEEFVLCGECGKPDTKLERVGKTPVLRCEACGAKSSVRSV